MICTNNLVTCIRTCLPQQPQWVKPSSQTASAPLEGAQTLRVHRTPVATGRQPRRPPGLGAGLPVLGMTDWARRGPGNHVPGALPGHAGLLAGGKKGRESGEARAREEGRRGSGKDGAWEILAMGPSRHPRGDIPGCPESQGKGRRTGERTLRSALLPTHCI